MSFSKEPIVASFRYLFGTRVFAIHSQPKFFAYFKKRHPFGRHGYQNPTLRVTPLPCSAVFYHETSKTPYFNPIVLRKSIDHGIENSVNDDFRISSRKMRKSFVDLIDQIPFRHNVPPHDRRNNG